MIAELKVMKSLIRLLGWDYLGLHYLIFGVFISSLNKYSLHYRTFPVNNSSYQVLFVCICTGQCLYLDFFTSENGITYFHMGYLTNNVLILTLPGSPDLHFFLWCRYCWGFFSFNFSSYCDF